MPRAPNTGRPDSVLGQGARFHRLQLGGYTPQVRPSAAKLISKLIFDRVCQSAL